MATLHHLRPTLTDKTFFSKSDLRVGSSLRYYGRRTDRGQLFFVQFIESKRPGHSEIDYLQTPRTLTDIIVLRDARNWKLTARVFGSLSYSAIWRLED